MNNESRGPAPDEALIILGGVLLFLGAGAFAAWWFCRDEIITAVLALQHWMMAPAHLVTDAYRNLDHQVLTADPSNPDIGPGDLWQLAHDVGRFWRWPASLLLLILAGLCARQARGRYKRDLDLRGLMREQAVHFRTIKPFLSRELGPVAPAEGEPRPIDPALHAGEWAIRFARTPEGLFSEAGARSALARQLGPLWAGYQAAQPHVRVLAAVFALFAARRREEAMDLLGDLAEAVPPGHDEGPEGPAHALRVPASVATAADAWMRDPEIVGPAERLAAGHAYTHTALMSLLCQARERSGVFNPGLFAFVQLIDRLLYMALDSLGAPTPGQPWHRSAAQAPYAEALGVREHWSTEREIGRPLYVPVVAMATNAIRAAAADIDEAAKTDPASRLADPRV
jgi:intracellular multiplication protein IcmP